jgi:hypothetical protein
MFTFSIESDINDTIISFTSSNLDAITRLLNVYNTNFELPEVEDEWEEVTEIGDVSIDDIEFDEEGYAWTFDTEFEAWFWFDEENEEWVEYEDDESEEDEAEEE